MSPPFRLAHPTLAHLDEIFQIETDGFPADEAASRSTLAFRIENAQNVFLCAFELDTNGLLGYVCGTLTTGDTLEHDSMTTHNPTGRTLCIHSVSVRRELWRQGLGLLILRQYMEHMRHEEIDRAFLLCHSELIGFYTAAGFTLIGKSHVVHGPDAWYDMKCEFTK
eukprot:TRINITY_DN6722_c0_g1_i1.p1 TRINITY_DN6722_c0_g1~~TRINITY_DN6722_c0_g1_i1.p1  ORF type:complete len:179 (-),score=13.67 TRINITY_DN6722_c0_g1_i1:207-704(-)